MAHQQHAPKHPHGHLRPVSFDPQDGEPQSDDDRFYVPSKDGQGHSSRLVMELLPNHMGEMSKLVQSGRTPFSTVEDVVRYGIHLALKECDEEGWTDPSVMRQVNALLDVLRDERFRMDFTNVFSQASDLVSRHAGEGQLDMARTLLRGIKSQITAMPPGDWRNKYETAFETLFGGYQV